MSADLTHGSCLNHLHDQSTFFPFFLCHARRKVAILFEELGLTYHSVYLNLQQKSEYTQYNPNGRVPAIIDHHNNDFVIWYVCKYLVNGLIETHWMGYRESDAILQYVASKYDKEHKLSVADEEDKYCLLQWLFFQASGQG